MTTFWSYLRRHHLGLIALFVALGGTSIAATNALGPRNSVGSAQVVNGSLQKVDLSKKTIAALRGRAGATGPAGPAGAAGATGPAGAAGAPATMLWAAVAANATIARGSKAVSATYSGGSFKVVFDRSVEGCGYVASIGNAGTGAVLGYAAVGQVSGNPSAVAVYTIDPNSGLIPKPFHLAVYC